MLWRLLTLGFTMRDEIDIQQFYSRQKSVQKK